MAVIVLNHNKFRLHGKALTILRISNDLKQIEIAEALGVTKGFISLCEKSKRKLSEIQTKKFIELIGTNEEQAKAFVELIGN